MPLSSTRQAEPNPQAYLANIIGAATEYSNTRLAEPLSWNYAAANSAEKRAA